MGAPGINRSAESCRVCKKKNFAPLLEARLQSAGTYPPVSGVRHSPTEIDSQSRGQLRSAGYFTDRRATKCFIRFLRIVFNIWERRQPIEKASKLTGIYSRCRYAIRHHRAVAAEDVMTARQLSAEILFVRQGNTGLSEKSRRRSKRKKKRAAVQKEGGLFKGRFMTKVLVDENSQSSAAWRTKRTYIWTSSGNNQRKKLRQKGLYSACKNRSSTMEKANDCVYRRLRLTVEWFEFNVDYQLNKSVKFQLSDERRATSRQQTFEFAPTSSIIARFAGAAKNGRNRNAEREPENQPGKWFITRNNASAIFEKKATAVEICHKSPIEWTTSNPIYALNRRNRQARLVLRESFAWVIATRAD